MLIQGDCLEKMKELEDNSVDTIITDPPYGLSFMGKKWDYDVPSVEVWQECLRVLKPGGTALIFAGSRTQHRMACNVEDAGFILFDTIMWLTGQGFPKSTNILKQLNKQCKCGTMVEYDKQKTKYNLRPLQEEDLPKTKYLTDKQREVLLKKLQEQSLSNEGKTSESIFISERKFESCVEGWCNILQKEGELYRCALCEMPRRVSENGEERWLHNGTPIDNGSTPEQVVNENGGSTPQRPQSEQQQDRKPCAFCEQFTPQEIRSWAGWGTHLKPAFEPIICARKPVEKTYANNALKWGVSGLNIDGGRIGYDSEEDLKQQHNNFKGHNSAKTHSAKSNFTDIKDHSTNLVNTQGRFPANIILDEEVAKDEEWKRYFYCAKASKSERNAGCDGLPLGEPPASARSKPAEGRQNALGQPRKNFHATVKPLKLMEYLCKLTATPTKGIVLDPFMGSGSTGVACVNTGRDFIGIELDEEYFKIAEARINS
jgi:DNA modification methylase